MQFEFTLNNNCVCFVSQSNEVKSSYHMELEGLKRSVTFLTDRHLQLGTIVTDRHAGIRKWVRETLPDCKHLFDVWHVAKGVSTFLYFNWNVTKALIFDSSVWFLNDTTLFNQFVE